MLTFGKATVVAAQGEPLKRAVAFVSNTTAATAPSSGAQLNLIPNPLEQFASFNTIWTLSCLSSEEFNNPSIYRNSKEPTNVVFSSAGRYDSARVNTGYGKPEFFINNFTMKTIIAPTAKTGNSNALKFEWELFEPYSMGLLLQSLQVAALSAGYSNYLDNAPYLLRMDFVGYDEDGSVIRSVKSKFFVLKLTKVNFQVNESGSTYKMEGIPYNHIGFSEEVDHVYNDVKLVADRTDGTVEEVLRTGSQSLCAVLNNIEKQMVDQGKIGVPDIYDIQFPITSTDFAKAPPAPEVKKATKDPNGAPPTTVAGTNIEVVDSETSAIGKSKFGFDESKGGNYIFKRHDEVMSKDGILVRDKMSIDVTNRAFMFSQGQSIVSIINQILLSSEYAFESIKKPDSSGYVKWWRVDVQVELLKLDEITGDYAKKFTFRVVPNLVHHSVFTNPNAAIMGIPEITKQIAKRYDYIYTGQNVNITKFDISINNLFYTGVNSSSEIKSALASNPNDNGPVETVNNVPKTAEGASPNSQLATLGRKRVKRNPKSTNAIKGGSGVKTTEQLVAEDFHRALIAGESADMVKINLEILGDPYWLADSGISNYFADKESETVQVTADGTMNYESGDVFIYISFRTPIDINEPKGTYDFSNTVGSPFSGIYRVIMCENQFAEGLFKQKLDCLRLPGQPPDFDNPALDPAAKKSTIVPDTALATQIGPPEAKATTPTESGYVKVA